jgi:hypothetical protein
MIEPYDKDSYCHRVRFGDDFPGGLALRKTEVEKNRSRLAATALPYKRTKEKPPEGGFS